MNLIVGGTGFVGGHLAEYFYGQGEISKAIFRRGSQLRILDQCGVQNYEGDLLERATLHEPLEGVEVVYNLASPTPKDGAGEYMKANTDGLRNLLEEAREHGVKTFAHLSTLDVYGFGIGGTVVDSATPPKPGHPYQKAKLEGEKILLEFGRANPGMKVRIVRAARAVGSRDTALTLPILRMIEQGEVILPSGSGRKASFTHPKDIAQALHEAAKSESSDYLHLIKSFDASAVDFAEVLAKTCGRDVAVRERGIFYGRKTLARYTVDQIRGCIVLGEQGSWRRIGYVPSYDMSRVGAEVADWYRKEPWITEGSSR